MLELLLAAAFAAYWKKIFSPFGLFDWIGKLVHWKIRKLTARIIFGTRTMNQENPYHKKFYTCIPCSYFRIGIIFSVLFYFFYPVYESHQYLGIPFAIGAIACIFHRTINE